MNTWKHFLTAASVIFVIIGVTYGLVRSAHVNLLGDTRSAKTLEFENTDITGYTDGILSWTIHAKRGWTSREQVTDFVDVSEGRAYQKKRLIFKNLTARAGRYYKNTEELEVYRVTPGATEEGKLVVDIDVRVSTPEGVRRPAKFYRLTTDILKYRHQRKTSAATGDIQMTSGKFKMRAPQATIDHNTSRALFPLGLSLTREVVSLLASQAEALFNEGSFEANAPIQLTIRSKDKKRSPTRVTARYARFTDQEKAPIDLGGTVDVVEPGKNLTALYASYDMNTHTLSLFPLVNAVFERGEALLEKDTFRKLRNPEAREALKEKTLLQANSMSLNTDTKDAWASGNVTVSQKGKTAKAHDARYSKARDEIAMTGDVYLERNNEWVKTQKVVVSVDQETFTAYGSVEAEFKLKR